MKYTPLIIIGAPRSGTNMLRDAICALDGFCTWPCDEINPVWKHGHLQYPYDDLVAEQARDELRQFVRKRFAWVAKTYQAPVVVEKTCANALRVAYLTRLLPEARFIFIYRNGVDAVASAVKRWRASMDIAYTARKLRFVPPKDLLVYGYRFLKNRLTQWSDSERRLRAWGPMTVDIATAARAGDIERAAALQWRRCVEYALDQFPAGAPAASVCYEHFVAEPQQEMTRLVNALDYDVTEEKIRLAVSDVRPNTAGRGNAWLAETGRRAELDSILSPAMTRLGYGASLTETG